MASAKFLEEALSTDVDESAVSAIVGTLETQLVTSTPSQHGGSTNIVNENSSISSGSIQKNIGIDCVNVPHSENVKIVSSVTFQPSVSSSMGIAPTAFIGQLSNLQQTNITGIQKPHEPVKLIYPQSSQALGNATINLSNRVAFPTQQLQNGNGALLSQTVLHAAPPGSIVSQAVNKQVPLQSSLVIKGTNPGQVTLPAGMVTVPMSVNTSMATSIPGVMALTKPINQNVVSSQNMVGSGPPTILPANVQILNMRPGNPTVAAQKTVAAVSPRVVIGAPQMMATRPPTPGITLQTLQGLQPGQQGHLLLKTENGQYQLLRVGPAPSPTTLTSAPAQGIRLSAASTAALTAQGTSTVAAMQQSNGMTPNPQTQMVVSATQLQVPPQMASSQQQSNVVPAPIQNIVNTQVQSQTVSSQQAQKASDNTKEKCRNFLANLLDLSSREPKSVERNVRNLIQELIDMRVEAEEFCDRLERLLNASPQPCLIGFLKKSLPLLRQSLVTKELIIEGIQPPPAHVAFAPQHQQQVQQQVQQQIMNQVPQQPQVHVQQGSMMQPQMMQPQLMPPQHLIQSQLTPHSLAAQPVARPVLNAIRGFVTPSSSPPITMGISGPSSMNQARPTQPTQMTPVTTKNNTPVITQATPNSSGSSSSKSSKEKDKKAPPIQTFFVDIDKMAGDDDINDVAAMGGVNLAEESQRILGSTEQIGSQIRSCKDEYFVALGPLNAKVRSVSTTQGLDEPNPEVTALLSHAVQDRLKGLIVKLACIAEHRTDMVKNENLHEVSNDVKGQLRFLEGIDRVERKKREDLEREVLLKAAKSRSKSEDPEQAKLKAKAKEMQRAEMEEMRQREANLTALQAIGPRKRQRQVDTVAATSDAGNSAASSSANSSTNSSGKQGGPLRSRVKRVNYRDLLFLLEQEPSTRRSTFLYKAYLRGSSK